MANGTQNMTTYKARKLSHTPGNTTTLLRGDNDFSNTLTGAFNLPGAANGANNPAYGLNIDSAHIGVNSTNDGTMGIYSNNQIYIIPNAQYSSDDNLYHPQDSYCFSDSGLTIAKDATYTLGNTDHKWKVLYLSEGDGSNNVEYGLNIGTAHIGSVNTGVLRLNTSGDIYLNPGTSINSDSHTYGQFPQYRFASSEFYSRPSSGDDFISLGTTTYPWGMIVGRHGLLTSLGVSHGMTGNNGTFIVYPKGGQYHNNTGGVTGILKISLPNTVDTVGNGHWPASMIKFTVSIYDYGYGGSYSTSGSCDFVISGYPVYSDNLTSYPCGGRWKNGTAISYGRNTTIATRQVTFAYDNVNKCPAIYIGTTDSAWYYPMVTIHSLSVGHANNEYLTWAQDFKISILNATDYATYNTYSSSSEWDGIITNPYIFNYIPTNLLPGADATYNIGSSSLKWKNMFLSGTIDTSVTTGTHANGFAGTGVAIKMSANAGYNMLARIKSTNGKFNLGVYAKGLVAVYGADTLTTNTYTAAVTLLDEDGNTQLRKLYLSGASNVNGATHSFTRSSILEVAGTSVFTDGMRIIRNESVSDDPSGADSLLYIENKTNADWSVKINNDTYGYGMVILGTGSALLKVGTNNLLVASESTTAGEGQVVINGTLRPYSSNTRTLGSSSYFWKGAYIAGGGTIHWDNLAMVGSHHSTNSNGGLMRVMASGADDINLHSAANKLWGMPADAITIEYSTNGTVDHGGTWNAHTVATTDTKAQLTTGEGVNAATVGNKAYDAGSGATNTVAAGYGVSITLDFTKDNRTGYIDCLAIGYSPEGNTASLKVERYNTTNNAWTQVCLITGLAANATRVIYPSSTFYMRGASTGGTSTYANKLRITFVITDVGTGTRYAPRIRFIYGWGPGLAAVSTGNANYPGNSIYRYSMCRVGRPYYINGRQHGEIMATGNKWRFYGEGALVAANTAQTAEIEIGNSGDIASQNTHASGILSLYSSSAYKASIEPVAGFTANHTFYLPNFDGTLSTADLYYGGSSTSAAVYYIKTDLVAGSSTNMMGAFRIWLTAAYSQGNAALIRGSFYWNKSAFTYVNYYDPTAAITGVSVFKSTGDIVYLKITSKGTYQYFNIRVGQGNLENNRAVSGSTTAPGTITGEVAASAVPNQLYVTNQSTTNATTYYVLGANSTGYQRVYRETGIYFNKNVLYGAAWNDYAEYRKDNVDEQQLQQPGRCAKENGDGSLSLTTKRLERGCEIISDTFGFAIGKDEDNGYNTPVASSGRVLAYPYESIEEFTSHIGWSVCSGPSGTVSIMTEEEEERYPGRIIGTISEIPSYETWGSGNVEVNGRVWIRIR